MARGNEKGRVERTIRYLRDAFFAARRFASLEDLNAQLTRWIGETAHTRPRPGDPDRRPGAALDAERPRLLPLPDHPFACDLLRPVVSGKTPYTRFDSNDYSIPHTLVRRPLTLVASDILVRLLDGPTEVARHPRSWDRGQHLEDEAHLAELARDKRHAHDLRARDRLRGACPHAEAFIAALAHRDAPLARQTQALLRMLDHYGPAELDHALAAALARGAIRAYSVAHLLDQWARARQAPPPLDVVLPADPRVRDLRVTPHALAAYDALLTPTPAPEAPMSLLADTLKTLGLHPTAAHLDDLVAQATKRRWSPTQLLEHLSQAEQQERTRRSLERRLARAKIGRFTPMSDFDWAWPTRIDRPAVDAALQLEFLAQAHNLVLVAAQGLGKTMLSQNIAYQAALAGHHVLFTTAAQLLLDLGRQDSARGLARRLHHYNQPGLLVIDEIGYLSYDARAADLLFQVVSRRYERRSLALTTNLPFSDWPTIFPNGGGYAVEVAPPRLGTGADGAEVSRLVGLRRVVGHVKARDFGRPPAQG